MRIAICEDNPTMATELEGLVANCGYDSDVFYSGERLVQHIQETKETYHLLFLDIEMPVLNGIETAKQIRKVNSDVLIVFVTDYKDYVYDVFEVLPFRFLCKPVTAENMKKTLQEAHSHLSIFSQLHTFQIFKEKYVVPYKDINYFVGDRRKVRLFTTENNSYEYYEKISHLLSDLQEDVFVQIHMSYIVNMEYIRSIRADKLTMQNGVVLPISKKFSSKAKSKHLAYLERRV